MSLLDLIRPRKRPQAMFLFKNIQLAAGAIQDFTVENTLRPYRTLMPWTNILVVNLDATCTINITIDYSPTKLLVARPGQNAAYRGQYFWSWQVKNTSSSATLAADQVLFYLEAF